MKSFDEWFGKASQDKLFWESPSKSSKMGYEAGAQSRQAEIDELNNRINRLEEDLRKAHNTIRSKSSYSVKWGENQND